MASLLLSMRTETAHPYEGTPSSKCFQLHMQPVELLGAADLLPLSGLLGSVCLHGEEATAQQVGPPFCHDGCTSLPQTLSIAEHQIVKSLLTVQ